MRAAPAGGLPPGPGRLGDIPQGPSAPRRSSAGTQPGVPHGASASKTVRLWPGVPAEPPRGTRSAHRAGMAGRGAGELFSVAKGDELEANLKSYLQSHAIKEA